MGRQWCAGTGLLPLSGGAFSAGRAPPLSLRSLALALDRYAVLVTMPEGWYGAPPSDGTMQNRTPLVNWHLGRGGYVAGRGGRRSDWARQELGFKRVGPPYPGGASQIADFRAPDRRSRRSERPSPSSARRSPGVPTADPRAPCADPRAPRGAPQGSRPPIPELRAPIPELPIGALAREKAAPTGR